MPACWRNGATRRAVERIEGTTEHSRQVFARLRGQKRLVIVAGAAHNQSLNDAGTWETIMDWIEELRLTP